jgi:hypothetical protein
MTAETELERELRSTLRAVADAHAVEPLDARPPDRSNGEGPSVSDVFLIDPANDRVPDNEEQIMNATQTISEERTLDTRWRVAGWAGAAAAVVAVVVGIAVVTDDNDAAPAVAGSPAEMVIGTWDFTSDNDSTLFVVFRPDGSFEVAVKEGRLDGNSGTHDKGEYIIDGDVITFESGSSRACETLPAAVQDVLGDGKTGHYRMVFEGPDSLDLQLIDDECGHRLGWFGRNDFVRSLD